MGAGAPYGNKNAEKWTLEESKSLYYKALDLANEKEDIYHKEEAIKIDERYKYDFIGEVARALKLYKSIFTELKEKHKALQSLHTQLVETLEANCFCNSKKGHIREATAIVNLKSNHKWTDRLDNTIGIEAKNIKGITFDE